MNTLKIKTVGELIYLLEKYPKEATVEFATFLDNHFAKFIVTSHDYSYSEKNLVISLEEE